MLHRFLDLLESYWDEAFAREWERIEPDLAASVTEAGRVIARHGVYALLRGLWPEVRSDPRPVGSRSNARTTTRSRSAMATCSSSRRACTCGRIAPVQQRIPDRHLAKALGLWEAGIAGAIAIAPVIATAIIASVGVGTGFVLSGGALIVIGATAALALSGIAGRALVYRAIDK